MKLADKIKMMSEYFESLGMGIDYSDNLIVTYEDDDGIYRNKETGAIRFLVKYKVCFFNYEDKKWGKDTSLLCIDILANGSWTISTISENDDLVILGCFTEEVAKTVLENLVKQKFA